MPLDSPLITTIIPTYRRPKLLRRAIYSVLNQTYPHFQVCIYDNASGDETAEIVKELSQKDPRVKYHCHPENIGALANFNYGLERVNTPFFSLLSDDDVILPNFFETALDGFEKFPDAIFSAGSVIAMTDKGHVIGAPLLSWKRDGYFSPPEGLFEISRGNQATITGVLFRKQVIDVFGGIDPEVVAADLDLEARLAARFPLVVSKEPCAIFVYHSASGGIIADSTFIWPSCLKILRNLREDNSISPDILSQVERNLTGYFTKMLFFIGLRSAIRSNHVDAHRAAQVLYKPYRLYTRALILESITRIFEHVSPVNKLALLVYNHFNLIHKNQTRRLQKDFGYLSKFLEL